MLLTLAATLLLSSAWAQDTAELSGVVVDASGAAVVGAEVRMVNMATGRILTSQSSDVGLYGFQSLQPGVYNVEVAKTGFKKFVKTDLKLEVGQRARLDIPLEVGNVSQSVTVNASTEILQTTGSSVSQEVQGRQVEDMPLNGRNVMNLLALSPGVVAQGSTQGATMSNQLGGALSQPGGWGNYQIGGGFGDQNATYIDGVPDNVMEDGNWNALVPTQDAIQEFRIETSDVSAEFGNFAGGVVNMSTKSGSNMFHGSLYEYLRNKDLNANNFFNNRIGLPRPSFTQNQYGANLGGPIIKDRTFFFFSWEGFALRSETPQVITVPTAAMRTGDFSAVAAIYDPCGGTVTTGGVGCPGFTGARTQFANNVIPTSRFDPTAVIMLNKYWANISPNLPGIVNNYGVNVGVGGNSNQYNGRVDHKLTEKQRIFGRYSDSRMFNPSATALAPGTGLCQQNTLSQQIVLGYNYVFSPTMVADFRASHSRLDYLLAPSNPEGADESQFGPNWATLGTQMQYHYEPYPEVAGYFGAFDFGDMDILETEHIEDTSYSASLAKIIGRHTIKFGGMIRRDKWFPAIIEANQSGGFAFNNAFTQSLANPNTTGYAFASFLLGYSSGGALSRVNPLDVIIHSAGLYVTDTFQANRKLTLNMGLRWDQPGAMFERNNLDIGFLPNGADPLGSISNPVTSQVQNLTGQIVLLGSSQYPDRHERVLQWHLFSPRLGFAYRATDQTVVRGGFGISFLPSDVYGTGPTWTNINTAQTPMPNTLNAGVTPNSTLSNPFLATTIIQPTGHNQAGLAALEGQGIIAENPYQAFGYAEQWNLSVQHGLVGGVFQIAYLGSAGVHLQGPLEKPNLDQLPDQYDSLGFGMLAPVANPFFGKITAGTLATPTVAEAYLLRPYPQFTGVSETQAQNYQSSYNSLQASFQRRFRGGGTLLAAYTWAKLMSDIDTVSTYLETYTNVGAWQDNTNIRADRSPVSFNVPQHVVFSYVLDLPFGKGKKWLHDARGVSGQLVSGWTVNGITTFQAGFPIALNSNATYLSAFFGAGVPRPNVVPACVKTILGSAQSRLNEWFNIGCFTPAPLFGFGSESRTDPNIRTPGINNFDFALTKSTAITERVKLQFDTEVFNLFNRVQFGEPGVTAGLPNFGVVSLQQNLPRLIQFALRLSF